MIDLTTTIGQGVDAVMPELTLAELMQKCLEAYKEDLDRFSVYIHKLVADKLFEKSRPEFISIIFDGPPGPEGPRFVEVEDRQGKSIKVGGWLEQADRGRWELRIPMEKSPISPSEAVSGFAAWISTRPETLSCGAEHECTPLIKALIQWCRANNLEDPRAGIYPDNLTVPCHETRR